MRRSLLADETGFIVSSELVLIATILVIGLIVGMSEVQHAVVAELNDVADAVGSANQSYSYSGFTKRDRGWGWGWGWGWGGVHAYTAGSSFVDLQDACDLNQCMLACNPPVVEAPKLGAYVGGGGGYSFVPAPGTVAVPVTPGAAGGVAAAPGGAGVVVAPGGAAVPMVPVPGVDGVPVVPVPVVPVPVAPVPGVLVPGAAPCTDCPATDTQSDAETTPTPTSESVDDTST